MASSHSVSRLRLRPDPHVILEHTNLCGIGHLFQPAIRSGRSPNLRLPFAGELEGALADWLGEGLVRRDGVEPFGRGLALGEQTVDQTQGLTLRLQFRRLDA